MMHSRNIPTSTSCRPVFRHASSNCGGLPQLFSTRPAFRKPVTMPHSISPRVNVAAVESTERRMTVDTRHVAREEAVMMQAFGWDSCKKGKGHWYEVVGSKIDEMQATGVSHVWLPPPSQSVSAEGYMPGQLYNLRSQYGDQEQLRELVQLLSQKGITPIADIVINHRCADEMSNGVYNKFRDDVDHKGRKIDWGKWAITGNDPVFGGSGNPDTGEDYGPAPDLDHANPELREALKEWMNWLKEDIGFEAWRLDFVKGYGPQFVEEYIKETVGATALNVGEYWVDLHWNGSDLDRNQDKARKTLCRWIDGNHATCAAFDFVTKGILQEACKHTQYSRLRDSEGKAPGLLGWWPAMAVTFVDNHDTGSSQQHWPFPSSYVTTGYAYILTHPGIPCIFWEHFFTWGPEVKESISKLMAVRQRNKIRADSSLTILVADDDMYVARIADRLVVKLGPRYDMGSHLPKEADGWKLATYGKDYAVWELQK